MKTNTFYLTFIFALLCFTSKAQTTIQTTDLTSYGVNAGTSGQGTFYGYLAGKNNASGLNTFIGSNSGQHNTSGYQNSFLGSFSGSINISGYRNVFIGDSAGSGNTIGNFNTYLGYGSGSANQSGENNVCIGMYAGLIDFNYSGASDNTFIGHYSGFQSGGSRNIFIGKSAGEYAIGNDLLYIANSNTSTPLVWGDFANKQLKLNAVKVGIGMFSDSFPTSLTGVDIDDYRVFVNGGILAKEIRVATTWADYVFETDYNLLPLNELESYIKDNGHLPNVPSAAQVEEQGIEVGEMTKIQQEKIEELTLYTIAQQKEIETQKEMLQQQQQQIEDLKKLVNQLIEKQ